MNRERVGAVVDVCQVSESYLAAPPLIYLYKDEFAEIVAKTDEFLGRDELEIKLSTAKHAVAQASPISQKRSVQPSAANWRGLAKR